jgi:hypothetical protein
MRELYERLLAATAEATRYRALAEYSESSKAEAERQYQAMLAALQHERDAAQAKADELASELARVKARGFWARLFGGK